MAKYLVPVIGMFFFSCGNVASFSNESYLVS